MWSEVFFMNLKDFSKHFLTYNSDTGIEHNLLEELKSQSYVNLREDYLKSNKSFPEI